VRPALLVPYFEDVQDHVVTITSIAAMTVLTIGVYILLRRRRWL
jgi:hypothetical protein